MAGEKEGGGHPEDSHGRVLTAQPGLAGKATDYSDSLVELSWARLPPRRPDEAPSQL